jgi:hypothetical protein
MSDHVKQPRDLFGTRRRLRERLPPLLEQEERIRFVWPAFRHNPTRFNPLWVVVSVGLIALWNQGAHVATIVLAPVAAVALGVQQQRRVGTISIVGTDRALLVVETTGLDGSRPIKVLARLSKDTTVGPLTRASTQVNLGGLEVWFSIAFAPEVSTWDAEAQAPDPPD